VDEFVECNAFFILAYVRRFARMKVFIRNCHFLFVVVVVLVKDVEDINEVEDEDMMVLEMKNKETR